MINIFLIWLIIAVVIAAAGWIELFVIWAVIGIWDLVKLAIMKIKNINDG